MKNTNTNTEKKVRVAKVKVTKVEPKVEEVYMSEITKFFKGLL